jgi:3-oxoacyl-[acyl-carrier-protein] synthase-3
MDARRVTLNASIVGWGTAIPDHRLTNADLEARLETNDTWIVERTGIRERRIAAPSETTGSLAIAAASEAIKSAGLTPGDIDLMIIATATPDQPIPHTGAFVGDALGMQCGSFDLNAACAGFVYELVIGASMVHGGLEHVLIVGSETLSRVCDPEDRTTVVLFGDGAGAAVLARRENAKGVLGFDLGCDGSAASLLEIRAGGSRLPTSEQTLADREQYLKMAGQQVFKRAVRAVVDSATLTLDRSGVDAADVAWFVPHQANGRIIDAAAQRLGFEPERTLQNIDRYGNTSSASIPLALFEAVDDGRVKEGDLVLCAGFGAGMTWASALMEWQPTA